MSLKGQMSLSLAAALVAAACGGGTEPAPPPQKAAAPPVTAAARPPAAVADGDFGVKECDDYIRKYLACVDSKVPEAARAMVRQGLEQTRTSWKQAASTPEGRSGLASACTQATAAARQSMGAYGCQW